MTRAPLWHSLDEVPDDLGATAVTIGNFDGMHIGHRAVLERLRRAAESRHLSPVALTFWPHPRHVMEDASGTPLITGHEDRDRLLLEQGVRGVLDLEFTLEFAQWSAEDFVRIFLVEGLGMRCVVMGADSRFGRGNEGDLGTMRELGEKYSFDVVLVEDLGQDDSEASVPAAARVSSSQIRGALLDGHVDEAARMMGRFHAVTDVVHHGFKRGRLLGFPTANLGPRPQGLVPADGVYTGLFTVLEQAPENQGTGVSLVRVPATISIGTNPTFPTEDGVAPRMVEAYVHAGHALELYGDLVRLEFVARQRPTVTFESAEALVQQMERDKDVTRRTLDLLGEDQGNAP